MLAILPGALCGVVPPVMGWLAGDGRLNSLPFAVMVSILFVWQFPHFWLILLFRRADYSKAALPNFLEVFGENALKRVLYAWLLSFSLLLGAAAVFSNVEYFSTRVFILLNAIAIAASASYLLFSYPKKPAWRGLFIHLNATLGVIMLAVILEKLFI